MARSVGQPWTVDKFLAFEAAEPEKANCDWLGAGDGRTAPDDAIALDGIDATLSQKGSPRDDVARSATDAPS
jgi:hypothetical protein